MNYNCSDLIVLVVFSMDEVIIKIYAFSKFNISEFLEKILVNIFPRDCSGFDILSAQECHIQKLGPIMKCHGNLGARLTNVGSIWLMVDLG